MTIANEELLKMDDLSDYSPAQIVSLLGLIFEKSREQNNSDDLKKWLKIADHQILNGFANDEKMIFHYNVANGWSYLQRINQTINSNEYWSFESEELEKQIINLRLALICSQNSKNDLVKCQILTNLGNLFSHIGRFSEAQSYWHLATEEQTDFPMAIGNIGFGLIHYAKVLYDTKHQSIFFKIAYKNLKDSLTLDITPEARNGFLKIISELENRFDKNKLEQIPNLTNYSLGKSKKDRLYRLWCLKNRLFLNPLNDIVIENISAHDCLLLPSMRLNYSEPPVYQTIFNQIKQEFVTARYLLYESMSNEGVHFSDIGNLQMDTLNYAIYSFSSEKLKISFRLVYSIFDKIGYLLNEYLKLGFKNENVSFRKIWYQYDKQGRPIGLKKEISETKNWAFRGLFWLSKDLFEKKSPFLTSIEPESSELASIRNFIEHKSFRLVSLGESKIVDNGLTYQIQRDKFELKILKLFRLVRAAMIYISLGIKIEEKKRKITMPIIHVDFIELLDEYKI